jgi:ATP-dependent HslUV protease subunit HslV
MAHVSTGGDMKGTTILGMNYKGRTVIGGDGQVTLKDTVIKEKARKIRKLHEGKVLAGFAGSVADAFTLFERFEEKLKEFSGNLTRAAVELAKDWRTDKYLRRLEALLAVLDKENTLLISGNGEVIEPDNKVIAIGSGGAYALAAANALMKFSDLDAKAIVEESLKIAAGICIYTNAEISLEEL